jgi:hypothetical protein
MAFKETIAAYFEIHVAHQYALWQDAEVLNVKAGRKVVSTVPGKMNRLSALSRR